MRSIAIDDSGVCQSVTRLRCANTAERIEVLLEIDTAAAMNRLYLNCTVKLTIVCSMAS